MSDVAFDHPVALNILARNVYLQQLLSYSGFEYCAQAADMWKISMQNGIFRNKNNIKVIYNTMAVIG